MMHCERRSLQELAEPDGRGEFVETGIFCVARLHQLDHPSHEGRAVRRSFRPAATAAILRFRAQQHPINWRSLCRISEGAKLHLGRAFRLSAAPTARG